MNEPFAASQIGTRLVRPARTPCLRPAALWPTENRLPARGISTLSRWLHKKRAAC